MTNFWLTFAIAERIVNNRSSAAAARSRPEDAVHRRTPQLTAP
jgi:hypothetical protein